MTGPRWVQHSSGIGEKWELDESIPFDLRSPHEWRVHDRRGSWHLLPKSEYVLVPPPEPPWVDVTEECSVNVRPEYSELLHLGKRLNVGNPDSNYRLRKVRLYLCEPKSIQNCEQWAFIVERKAS